MAATIGRCRLPVPALDLGKCRPRKARSGTSTVASYQALKPVTITCCESFRQLPRLCRRPPVNPNNLTIAPKLGIVVGVAQLGLCVAVALAVYLLQREMPNPAILGGAILGIAT